MAKFHSKQSFMCLISNCGAIFRGDALNRHYRTIVEFDQDGNPLMPNSDKFKKMKKNKQEHTRYFFENGYTSLNLPKLKTPANAPKNPWDASRNNTKTHKRNRTCSEELTAEPVTENDSKRRKTSDWNELIQDISNILIDDQSDTSDNCDNDSCEPILVKLSDGVSGEEVTEGEHDIKLEEPDQNNCDAVNISDTHGEKNIGQDIVKQIIEALNSKNELALTLANTVADLMNSQIQKSINGDKENDDTDEVIWDFFEGTQECIPCKLYKHKAPSTFKYYRKESHGIFFRPNEDETVGTNKFRRKKIREHETDPLHAWCLKEKKLAEKSRNAEESENLECGKKLVENVVFCLLTGGSAKDYVRMNSKQASCDVNFPTKNDGGETFFEIREIIFEELTDVLKAQFRTVKNASFSLDKVTVRNIPYTVLVTYFFDGGRLRAVLNSIHQMKSSEYDAESTAEMIGKDLMVSLGEIKII